MERTNRGGPDSCVGAVVRPHSQPQAGLMITSMYAIGILAYFVAMAYLVRKAPA